ncbi:MAG: tetratricopeptide repeat protein [Marinosulfonomonas sp.]|nr:tetratricopeptide repeat protein [Marinosulfonomonas sp.]
MKTVSNAGLVYRRVLLILAICVSAALLAGCDSAEERAERHFQSALALLEKGDIDRATVEFRNVFDLNGRHHDARATFAKVQRDRGNIQGSVGQYLRLVEQYPDDIEGNRALAEIFAELGRWDNMERHLNVVLGLLPDDPIALALQVIFNYQNAIGDREFLATESAVAQAVGMKSSMPDYILLRQVIIDDLVRHNKFSAALRELDEAIEIAPENRNLYSVKLSVLGALGDAFEIEALLKEMIERFPTDRSSRVTLVRWYVSQHQLDEAEQFLRQAIDPASNDPTNALTLIKFITDLRGPATALDELTKLIASGASAPVFRSLQAGLIFELGNPQKAIAQMYALVEELEKNDEARAIRVTLAQMLVSTGSTEKARALIDEIIQENSSHVAALKMEAEWLIQDDRVGEAIAHLRTALDRSPKDADIITMMARAHERDGNQELVGEMLSLAVVASNRAPEETINYARYLGRLGKFSPAESILIDALRLAPSNIGLLSELGNIYLGLQEWSRAEQVVNTLQRLDTPGSNAAAGDLHVRFLAVRKDIDSAVAFLEGLVSEGAAGFNANVAIVRAYLTNDQAEKARTYVDGLLAEMPADTGVLFMDAAVNAAIGRVKEAETAYRTLLQQNDRQLQVWIALFRVVIAQGRLDEGKEILAQSQAVFPDDPTLEWIKAGVLENDGDIAGAIAVYEALYAKDSDNLIVANNLASLLSSSSDDPNIISRAYAISRRLRVSTVPHYQDTYGWVAFLRGEYSEAIKSLSPAAAAMKNDPTVQYHLAKAYAANGRFSEALDQYRKVVDITGPADSREFVIFSRAEVRRLDMELENAVSE